MKKTISKFGLFLLAVLLPTGCSCDEEEISIDEKDLIGTISDVGTIGYSKDHENNSGENRWYIHCSPKMDFYIDGGTYYFPSSLPKQYQKEGIQVKFDGDIYPFVSKYGGSHASGFPVGGYYFYFIKLNNIKTIE